MLDIDAAIRSRAYEFWQADGESHGRDLDHWLRAESEVSALTAPAQPPARKTARKPAAKARATRSRSEWSIPVPISRSTGSSWRIIRRMAST